MKRLWFIAFLAATSACVEGNNPVQLLSAIPFDPESCDQAEQAILRGRLNYAVNSSYVTTFAIFSPVTSNDVGAVAFYCEEVVYSYETQKPSISIPDESLAIFCAVPPATDPGDSYFGVDLIGNEARKKLEAAVPAAPDAMTLLTTIKIKGHSGAGKSLETNEVTFPIEISRGTGCTTGVPDLVDAQTYPCGYPGQDAFYNRFACR